MCPARRAHLLLTSFCQAAHAFTKRRTAQEDAFKWFSLRRQKTKYAHNHFLCGWCAIITVFDELTTQHRAIQKRQLIFIHLRHVTFHGDNVVAKTFTKSHSLAAPERQRRMDQLESQPRVWTRSNQIISNAPQPHKSTSILWFATHRKLYAFYILRMEIGRNV